MRLLFTAVIGLGIFICTVGLAYKVYRLKQKLHLAKLLANNAREAQTDLTRLYRATYDRVRCLQREVAELRIGLEK